MRRDKSKILEFYAHFLSVRQMHRTDIAAYHDAECRWAEKHGGRFYASYDSFRISRAYHYNKKKAAKRPPFT